jgi:hypothetical protein
MAIQMIDVKCVYYMKMTQKQGINAINIRQLCCRYYKNYLSQTQCLQFS